MKKYAFFLMGSEYLPEHHAVFETEHGITIIDTVRTLEEAVSAAKKYMNEGVGAIELCGAFGEAGARQIIDATEGKVAVGFVTHLPEQDQLFEQFFS